MASTPLLIPVGYQFLDNSGKPLAGGTLTTYAAGTTSLQATYSDEALSVQNPNPIPLNAAGRCASGTGAGAVEVNVYPTGVSYKLLLQDANGTTIWTHDNIDPSAPWNLSGTPVFPQTIAGTTNSGGIPYCSTATQLSISGTLAAHGVVVGEGAGASPVTIGTGTTGQILGSNGASADPSFQAAAGLGASWVLLKSNSGTDTTATATNVDTVAISGLTANDVLRVMAVLESVTQQTAGVVLYSTTDATQVGYLAGAAAILAGGGGAQESVIMVRQGSTTALSNYLTGGTFSNSNLFVSGVFNVTTAWTGSWTLGLRHTGVTAGGTFKWRWSVYKVSGQ